MAELAGIDVSHWQGVIDWSLARDGLGFVYLKATDGTAGVDPRFTANWGATRAASLPRGAYHFFRPADVEGQVERFLATVGEDPGELPPALDLEVGPMDRAEFELALLWLEAIEAHYGRVPALYLNHACVWDLELAAGQDDAWLGQFARYPLWIADYSGAEAPRPQLGPWSRWTFWQHTPQGSTVGINAAVDLDWYAGSALELASLIRARVGSDA